MHLDKSHIRLLGKIKKGSVIRTDKKNIADLNYLYELSLIEACVYDKADDFFCQPRITELGRAVHYELTKQERKTDFALFLSALAIIISLLTAFTPFDTILEQWLYSIILHT